jgi:hypothetical protein
MRGTWTDSRSLLQKFTGHAARASNYNRGLCDYRRTILPGGGNHVRHYPPPVTCKEMVGWAPAMPCQAHRMWFGLGDLDDLGVWAV